MDRLETLLEFHREDPKDAFTRFALASEYLKRERLDEALETFESLLGDRPDYVGTYYHLAALYRRLDRPDEARKTYESGIAEAVLQGDHHAESELRSALMELELGLED